MLCSFNTHHHTLGASRDVSRGRPLVRVRFILVPGSKAAHQKRGYLNPSFGQREMFMGLS